MPSFETPDALPHRGWNSRLHEVWYFLLYFAPLTGLPVFIAVGVALGSFDAATITWLLSFAVPPLTFVYRSLQNRTRKRFYERYRRPATQLNEFDDKLSLRGGIVRQRLSPDAARLYGAISDTRTRIPNLDFTKLLPEHINAWETAVNSLLKTLAPIVPNRTIQDDLSDIPAKVNAYFLNDQQTYILFAIHQLAACHSFLAALSTIASRLTALPLSPSLHERTRDILTDIHAVHEGLQNRQIIFLHDPPPSTPLHELEAFYREELHEYFYGSWEHLKKNAQALGRSPFLPETREGQYTIADLAPDIEVITTSMYRAQHCGAAFGLVVRDPSTWQEQFDLIYKPLEHDAQAYLATADLFTLGTTANLTQPNANMNPPFALTLSPSERRTHTYVIGRTGSGKTTLLKNLITQDLRNDQQGVVVLSPENKIFEDLLDLVPPDRAHSLIYFDPTDTRPPVIGFNPFTFEDGDDLNQKAQETYTIFERALGDLGVKMTTMLQNAAYALIQRKNSRLLDLDTLLNPSNNSLRHRVARDPAIDERTRNFWQAYDSSAYYKSAYEPVVNRLDPFFRPPHATILSTNSFSWDEVLNKKPHIIFCNLSRLKGVEAQIMGQLLIAQIQQTIFHRDPKPESTYIPYALYIDEFQTYATTGEQSFIETLNKARKYHFALTLAHQVTSDIPPKLLSSIVGNVGTVIALRTSAEDAPFFAKDLQIKDADGHSRPDLLQNLPIGQAIVRTPSHNIGITIGVPAAPPPLQRDTPGPTIPRLADTYATTLKMLSKRNFGTQPTVAPPPVDTMAQQPISNATAAAASDDETAAAVIATAPEPEPDSADPGTIVIDETENPLTRTTRRRGRPPRSTTANPAPASSRRRRIITNGDNNPNAE